MVRYVGNPTAECLTLTGAVKHGCLHMRWEEWLTAPARAKGGLAIGLPPAGWLQFQRGRVREIARAGRWLRRSLCDRLETSQPGAGTCPSLVQLVETTATRAPGRPPPSLAVRKLFEESSGIPVDKGKSGPRLSVADA